MFIAEEMFDDPKRRSICDGSRLDVVSIPVEVFGQRFWTRSLIHKNNWRIWRNPTNDLLHKTSHELQRHMREPIDREYSIEIARDPGYLVSIGLFESDFFPG
ncbi:MAG: hypothetical protein H7X97_10875 [Opitutaceae bacterium]|nr:hypothetical protein [Verrucomicrobiales bacterium]